MPAETNLDKLLAELTPVLDTDIYVFVSLPYSDPRIGSLLACSCASMHEKEGLSLVIKENDARDAQLTFSSLFKKITLTVHSSLDAVGLTAVVSNTLAKNGISANVIAAYYHDHIFIPESKAEIALKALSDLTP